MRVARLDIFARVPSIRVWDAIHGRCSHTERRGKTWPQSLPRYRPNRDKAVDTETVRPEEEPLPF